MKKSARTTQECIERLEATVDALVSEGADPSSIMGVLVKVMVRTALKTRDTAASLGLAADVLLNAADRASEQAKKNRADKRAKRLGLIDD